MSKSNLLIDEQPLILLPSLAKVLGLELAVLVQQLHFLLSIPKCGRVIEGEKWIWNTYKEWQKEAFPFWSQRVIRRLFTEAEEQFLVISSQPEGWGSRRKYYRLNKGMMEKLVKSLAESTVISEEEITPSGQICHMDSKRPNLSLPQAAKSVASLSIQRLQTETTEPSAGFSLLNSNQSGFKAVKIDNLPPIASRPSPKKSSSSKPIPIDSNFPRLPESLSELTREWEDWKIDRRERKKPLTSGAATRHIKMLEKMGIEVGKATINKAIQAGWTDLYPVKPEHQSALSGKSVDAYGKSIKLV